MISGKSASKRVQKNFLSGLHAASLGQFMRRLVGFLANLYLLKLLTPDAMGKFVILQFLVMQIPYYVGMGINMAVVREGSSLSLDQRRSAFTAQLFVAGVLGLAVWSCVGSIYRYYDHQDYIKDYLPWMLLLVPVIVIKQILINQWQVRLAFSKITTADLIEHIGYLAIAIVGCQFTSPLLALLLGFCGGRILSTAYLCQGFRTWIVFLPRFYWRELQPLLSFGSFVQLGNICNMLIDSMVPLVLGKLYGAGTVGLVTWAMRIVWVPQSITNFIDSISFATFCRLDFKKRRYQWILNNLSQAMLAFTGLYLLVLNLFFPQLLEHVLGTQWMGTRTLVFFFSTYVLAYSPCTVLVQAIFANNGVKFLFKVAVFNMISAWTVGAAMIYFYGTAGIGYYYLYLNIYPALIFIYGSRHARFKWNDAVSKPLLALLASGIVFLSYRAIFVAASLSVWQTTLECAAVVALNLALHYLFWARPAFFLVSKMNKHRHLGKKIISTEDSELRDAS